MFPNSCDVTVPFYALIPIFIFNGLEAIFVMNKCSCCTVSVACSSGLIKAT